MTVHTWSGLEDGSAINFFPGENYDVLNFDVAINDPSQPLSVTAAQDDLYGTVSVFSLGGKTVTLRVDPRALTHHNFTFVDGGLFIFGDDDTSTGGDDAGNTFAGGDAGDWLSGGGGNDVLSGSGGVDLLSGGLGNDSLTGGLAGDSLSGGGGDDTLVGGDGNDTLDGGDDFDTMIGGAGDDGFIVTTDSDVVTELENQGTDTVYSSVTRTLGDHQENLTLTGSNQIDGTGNALANVMIGNDQNNVLIGGDGDDLIEGRSGDDSMHGEAGNDTLDGGDGDDTMRGGTGDDVYHVGSVVGQDKVFENLDEGIDTVFTERPITLGANIENATWEAVGGGGICHGNELSNILTGRVLQGVGMDGKGGIDTISYAASNLNLTIDLAGGLVSSADSGSTDTLANLENALGGLGDDSIIGDSIANVLNGNTGADTMAGGYGNDTYIVDDLGDVVSEADNDTLPGGLVVPGTGAGQAGIDGITDTVLAAISFSLENVENVENLELQGSATDATGNTLANALTGTDAANLLSGLGGNDTLTGAAGNDTLDGGAGIDSMIGGSGNDVYLVNAGTDKVVDASGIDTVRASASLTLASGIEHLILIGSALNGTGNGLANRITGNANSNVLDGKEGADTLNGGGGNDTLIWRTGDIYDGGGGTDKLKLISGSLNLTATANTAIRNVEQIDLTAGGNNRLTLNQSDVLDLSSTTNTIKVLGTAGDSLDIVGAFTAQGVSGGFRTYKVGTGFLQVDTDIVVT